MRRCRCVWRVECESWIHLLLQRFLRSIVLLCNTCNTNHQDGANTTQRWHFPVFQYSMYIVHIYPCFYVCVYILYVYVECSQQALYTCSYIYIWRCSGKVETKAFTDKSAFVTKSDLESGKHTYIVISFLYFTLFYLYFPFAFTFASCSLLQIGLVWFGLVWQAYDCLHFQIRIILPNCTCWHSPPAYR